MSTLAARGADRPTTVCDATIELDATSASDFHDMTAQLRLPPGETIYLIGNTPRQFAVTRERRGRLGGKRPAPLVERRPADDFNFAMPGVLSEASSSLGGIRWSDVLDRPYGPGDLDYNFRAGTYRLHFTYSITPVVFGAGLELTLCTVHSPAFNVSHNRSGAEGVVTISGKRSIDQPNNANDKVPVMIEVLSFSPDGTTLAAGCADGTIRLVKVPQ